MKAMIYGVPKLLNKHVILKNYIRKFMPFGGMKENFFSANSRYEIRDSSVFVLLGSAEAKTILEKHGKSLEA
jgi:hypothetical protein